MKLDNHNRFNIASNDIKDNRVKVIDSEPFLKNFKLNFSIVKKGLLILAISVVLHNHFCEKDEVFSEISINMEKDDFSYFAKYSLGKVYICSEEDKYFYQRMLEENDILVIDKRCTDNPDMCVYNSCMVNDVKTIVEVLLILEEYEKEYPSDWGRTLPSMYNEWVVHNVCYSFNYRTISTQHVDLDNEDEDFYSSPIFKLLIKNKF